MSTITYCDCFERSYTIPLHTGCGITRESGCLDVCLSRAVGVSCPLKVAILIRTDGTVVHWYSEWCAGYDNTYWHFSNGSDELATGLKNLEGTKFLRAPIPPTSAQRAVLGSMWLGRHAKIPVALPGGLEGALGVPVTLWTFQEFSSIYDIAAEYGDGSPVYLA
jgi:hypothetical protein